MATPVALTHKWGVVGGNANPVCMHIHVRIHHECADGNENPSLAIKPHSHCAGVATVHPDAGQPVYRDAPGHIS